MIRDQGPIYNLGFGANSRNLPRWEGTDEERGPNPNSGIVSKVLNKNPAMKFIAASAATIMVGTVASSMVRKGGLKLFSKLETVNKPWATQAISDIKSIRDHLDAFQGITRTYSQGPLREDQLFGRKILQNGSVDIDTGDVQKTSSFFITREEQLRALRTGRAPGASWTMADEIQQRLVSSARRMPYELPAFYVTQKALVDPLMGDSNDPKKKVNWYNPVDVITDFVNESAKIAVTALLPFEAGTAASKQGWRRFMTYGDDLAKGTNSARSMRTGPLTMKALLGQVGADSVDVTNRVLNFSSRTTGAFAAGLEEAQKNRIGLVDYMHRVRHGTTDWSQMSGIQKTKALIDSSRVLDLAPGPFRGIGSGIRAADKRYREILASQEAYKQFASLGSSALERDASGAAVSQARKTFIGRKLQDYGVLGAAETPFNGSMAEALQSELGRTSHGMEQLVRQWGAFSHGRPVLGQTANTGLKEGQFYQNAIQGEYENLLLRSLKASNVDDKSAQAFVSNFVVSRPRSSGVADGAIDITNRIRVNGRGSLAANTEDDFFDNILNYLNKRSGSTSSSVTRSQLKKSIEKADGQFLNASIRRSLDTKIQGQFDVLQNQFLPLAARAQMKELPLDYTRFNKARLSPRELEVLQRKTAGLTGLDMASSNGLPVSNDVVIGHLRRKGLDPENTALLKGMLIDKKALSKPWNRDGFNAFGLRRLTVESALQKGIFKSGQYDESDARAIINRIVQNDPSGATGQFALKGAWETQGGKVLDFTAVTRGVNKTLNTLASEYQVPLLKFNPLQMGNWTGSQELRDKGIFQFIPGMSNQAFLRGKQSGDDFYLWMKSGKGSKGKVFAMSSASGEPVLRKMQGTYRPHSAANAMFEKHARYAIRDEGFAADKVAPVGVKSKIKNFFAVSEDKQDSIFGYLSRFRNRKFDLNNRQTFAKLLSEGKVQTKRGTITLQEAMNDPQAFDKAARGFFSEMGSFNIADEVLEGLAGTGFGGRIGSIDALSYNLKGKGAKTISAEVASVRSLRTPAQFEEFGQIIAREDEALIRSGAIVGDRARAIQTAKNRFIDSHLRESFGPGYWEKRVGTGTRLDAYKRDLNRYLSLRGSTLSHEEFNREFPEILAQIGRMRTSGTITQAQATEAKAALMSIQYDITNIAGAKASVGSYQNLRGAIERFVDASPVTGTQQVLREISSGKIGTQGGILGDAQAAFFRGFRSAKYEYPGAVFNPFGSKTVLAPTFGSTFFPSQGGSPLRAMKSVLGISTYKDPESFSGTSVIMSHLVNRINKPFSALSIGLDPTKFSGPLDMYARGIVGKRVLPIVAGGTALVTGDRVLGGYLNEKDQYGERVYSPYVMGKGADAFVKSKAVIKDLIPGGETYSSEMEKMESGEVPIRAGRWWPLGNTPFRGGRIQYFRPNWYRRLKSGYTYTDQTYGSPLERLAYGYDFSPLRAIDPYRFERKHYYDRPYPETGEYFTGPWGPLTSALNMTVGRVLKPKIKMHQQELEMGLSQYAPVGDYGAYVPPTSQFAATSIGSGAGMPYGGMSVSRPMGASSPVITVGGYGGPRGSANIPMGFGSSSRNAIASSNMSLAAASAYPNPSASAQASQMVANINQQYADAAYSPAYGTLKQPGMMDPRIIAGASPISTGSLKFRASQLGYEAQELAGIYGFAFGATRTALGFGTQDMSPDRPVLASASKAYGSTRAFWDLNIGGLGDFPLPIDGNLSNLEFSEIARRFIPKERKDVQYVNPIKNDMGIMYPWLPGSDYYINFKQGDPYTHVAEGEMRLPGAGYERFHKLSSDVTGKYGIVDQFKILGDVAPWSQQYRQLDSMLNKMNLGPRQSEIVQTTRQQVEAKAQTNEFTPYNYTYGNNDPNDTLLKNVVGRVKERIEHSDTYFNTKFLQKRTAVEDWERDNIYGATFPEWQNPIEDFLKPMAYKSTQRGPLVGAASMGFVGSLFGKTLKAKAIGSFIGGTVGLTAGSYGKIYEGITGRQFMPERRKKEIALEEYTDILTYVKNMHLSAAARSEGNQELAAQFMNQAKQTMYGADIYQGNLSQIALAIPKRKREHFKAMLSAPVQERKRILDTSGRLERRIYQAAWGMPVEKRPDLNEYFSDRELPTPGWEGFNPSTSMDQVKIKIGQSMGLDMSEMGYYPQQLKEANLVNVSYPSFDLKSNRTGTAQRLRELLRAQNIQGDVIPILTPFSGDRVDLRAGVY